MRCPWWHDLLSLLRLALGGAMIAFALRTALEMLTNWRAVQPRAEQRLFIGRGVLVVAVMECYRN